jgi:Mrp family chromosome partitioning ATPase
VSRRTTFRGSGSFDYLVPRTSLLAGSAALLNRGSVSNILGRLRKNYGLVVVDSPPILGISDATVLSADADYTVYVVRWGQTETMQAIGAADVLSNRGANIIGFVLNAVDTKAYDDYALSFGDCRGIYKYYRHYYEERGSSARRGYETATHV